MKLTILQLKKLGLVDEEGSRLKRCLSLLQENFNDSVLGKSYRESHQSVFDELKQDSDLIDQAIKENQDEHKEIISLADLQRLLKEVRQFVANKVSDCDYRRNPYFIHSQMNWGDDLKRAYELQESSFREGNSNHYLLASIDAVKKINNEGENFPQVIDELNSKIKKIGNNRFEQAVHADRFNAQRNYTQAYRVRTEEQQLGFGWGFFDFNTKPPLSDRELLDRLETEKKLKQSGFDSSYSSGPGRGFSK